MLGAQGLLQGHRVDRAALDRGVVGEDEALDAADATDAGDLRRGRGLAVVHALGRQGRKLQERCGRVEQHLHPLTGQQLAGLAELGRAALAAAGGRPGLPLGQLIDQRQHSGAVGAVVGGVGDEGGFETYHLERLSISARSWGRPASCFRCIKFVLSMIFTSMPSITLI